MALKTAIIAPLIFLGLLIFTKSSQAATYYVKNGGNDNAAGTNDATAWARVPGMAGWSGSASLQSGDIVYFRSQDNFTIGSGTYGLYTTSDGVTYNGTDYGSGTRATFTSTAGHTAMVMIVHNNITFEGIDVNGNTTQTGGIYINYDSPTKNISGVTVNNNIVRNIGATDNYIYGIIIGSINSHTTNNVTITNNVVYNTVHEGIIVYPSTSPGTNAVSNVTIRGNEVYNTGRTNASFGNGLAFKNSVTNLTFEFNYSHDNGNNGMTTVMANGTAATNIHIRYNLFKNNPITGIYLNPPGGIDYAGVNIYGNLFVSDGNGGIVVNGGDYSGSTLRFYNNTFYETGSGAYGLLVGTLSGSPVVEVKNNIFYTASNYGLGDFGNQLTHGNNLYFRTSGATAEHANVNGNSYNRTTVKSSYESSSQNSDPLFKNTANLPSGFSGTYGSSMELNTDGLSLQSSSLGINNGSTLASPYNGAVNLSGKGLTRSGSFDIGAYEYVSSSPPPPDTTPPAAPANVRVS